MASYAFVLPVLPGKTEVVRRFGVEMSGPRRGEAEESQRRIGITRQMVWLQQTPQGDMCVVYWETDDPARVFQKWASSDNPFDRWFLEQLKEIHGIDLTQPPPPNELIYEWQAR